jgi:hypothetical protein
MNKKIFIIATFAFIHLNSPLRSQEENQVSNIIYKASPKFYDSNFQTQLVYNGGPLIFDKIKKSLVADCPTEPYTIPLVIKVKDQPVYVIYDLKYEVQNMVYDLRYEVQSGTKTKFVKIERIQTLLNTKLSYQDAIKKGDNLKFTDFYMLDENDQSALEKIGEENGCINLQNDSVGLALDPEVIAKFADWSDKASEIKCDAFAKTIKEGAIFVWDGANPSLNICGKYGSAKNGELLNVKTVKILENSKEGLLIEAQKFATDLDSFFDKEKNKKSFINSNFN